MCVFSDNALSMGKRFYLLSRLSITFTKLVCMLLPVLLQSFVDVVGYLDANATIPYHRCDRVVTSTSAGPTIDQHLCRTNNRRPAPLQDHPFLLRIDVSPYSRPSPHLCTTSRSCCGLTFPILINCRDRVVRTNRSCCCQSTFPHTLSELGIVSLTTDLPH